MKTAFFVASTQIFSARLLVLFLTLTVSYTLPRPSLASEWGEFTRNARVELLDFRQIKLLEDFYYTAPDGTVWIAPVDWVVDGASVPRIAWQFAPPLTGRYRDASIIHDVACDREEASWESVHRAFYTAMRARGVSAITAKLMYAAVYHFGPRWERKQKFRNIRPIEVGALTTEFETSAPRSAVDQNIDENEASRADDPRIDLTLRSRPPQRSISESEFEFLTDSLKRQAATMSLDDIEVWNPE